MRPVAAHVYRDPAGQPLRRKLRYEPKTFAWQTYDPATDTWTWGASDPTATVYNLHVIAADRPETVFVCEGEKDTDNVMALGLPAVTSGNAGTWKRHHSDQLRDHGCTLAVVLPDHDDPGRKHAYDVARQNLAVGISTKIVALPDLQEHEDVSDFLERGGTRELLLGLARCTPPVTLADLPAPKPEPPRKSFSGGTFHHDQRLNALFVEKLKLPPTAHGRLMIICPFHLDANPSLSLDLDKGVWYCHGCQEGGGVVAFYTKVAAQRGRVVTRSEAWRRLKATYL